MTDKEEQSDELLVLSEILDAPNFSHEGKEILNFIINKFALLWGEAQLCLPYVCL